MQPAFAVQATKRLLSTLETDSPGAGAPGTVDLGAAGGCELVARLRAVRAAPAFSLMVALPRAVPCKPCVDPVEQPRLADSSDGASAAVGASAFDAATVAGSRELAWVACDSSKPGAPLLTRQTSPRQHPSVCVHSPLCRAAGLCQLSEHAGASPPACAARSAWRAVRCW